MPNTVTAFCRRWQNILYWECSGKHHLGRNMALVSVRCQSSRLLIALSMGDCFYNNHCYRGENGHTCFSSQLFPGIKHQFGLTTELSCLLFEAKGRTESLQILPIIVLWTNDPEPAMLLLYPPAQRLIIVGIKHPRPLQVASPFVKALCMSYMLHNPIMFISLVLRVSGKQRHRMV